MAADGLTEQARQFCLVFVGGTMGTALRYGLSAVTPSWNGVPVVTLGINVVGALVLGLLLELLLRHGLDAGRRHDLRLLLGTGFLGGFTTYSALATDTVVLVGSGAVVRAVAYAVGTVVLGLASAAIGVALGRRLAAPGRAL